MGLGFRSGGLSSGGRVECCCLQQGHFRPAAGLLSRRTQVRGGPGGLSEGRRSGLNRKPHRRP